MKLSRIGRNRALSWFPYAATVAFVSCHLFVIEVSLRWSNGMLYYVLIRTNASQSTLDPVFSSLLVEPVP